MSHFYAVSHHRIKHFLDFAFCQTAVASLLSAAVRLA